MAIRILGWGQHLVQLGLEFPDTIVTHRFQTSMLRIQKWYTDLMNKSLQGMCESCLMPFKKDPKGVNREHERYCSYCFQNGKLSYEGNDLMEFKKTMIEAIVARGENRLKAKFFAFIAGFAPRWKKK